MTRTGRLVVSFGLVAGLAVVGSSPAGAAGLSVKSLKPKSGPIGTTVTIKGTGLDSGDIVSFNGTTTSASAANAGGTKLVTSVPPLATTGPVTVTDALTGQTAGGVQFRVTKGIVASPDHIWAGGQLTLAGSGLSPDASDPVYLGSAMVGEARIDSTGSFDQQFPVPWTVNPGPTKVSIDDTHTKRLTTIVYVFTGWPEFDYDVTRSGTEPYEPTLTPSTVGGLTQQWTLTPSDGGTDQVAVADGIAYFGSYGNALYAVNASTGAAAWTAPFPASGAIVDTPAVSDGVVYFGTLTGDLYAVNASTGAPVWASPVYVGGDLDSSPAVAYGNVYIGSGNGDVYAFNATTGAPAWTSPFVTGDILSAPAVSGGVVYVGSWDDDVYAINATTGAAVWSAPFATGASIVSTPVVADGSVFIGSDDDSVYALDAATGAKEWQDTTGDVVEAPPVFCNGVVYVGSEDGNFYALNATNGSSVWTYENDAQIDSAAAVAGGIVYFGDIDGYLHAIDTTSGKQLFSTRLDGSLLAPSVSNGMVYDAALGGEVAAYGL